jgi:hypothetical protein
MPLVAASFLQVADPSDGIPPNPADFASSANAGFGGMKTLPGAEGLVRGQAVWKRHEIKVCGPIPG